MTLRNSNRNLPNPAAEAYNAGVSLALRNPAMNAINASFCWVDCERAPSDGWALVESDGCVHANAKRHGEPAEWAWIMAHCLLHLGFGHVPAATGERTQPDRFDIAARCVVVNRFLQTFSVGRPPVNLPVSYPDGDEEQLAARWRRDGIPEKFQNCGVAGSEPDQLLVPWHRSWADPPDWTVAFAQALTRTVSAAMDMAGGRRDSLTGTILPQRPWNKALSWFVSSYPLLGGIASGMTLVADAELARAHDIAIAAVNAEVGEIYVNPLIRQSDEEWRFVLAHEMLHAALRHGERCGPRDQYLFNVAADYVVNGWLIEMGVGQMPQGVLYDADLKGLSVEEIYDRIVNDRRRQRRMATLRGRHRGDILGEPLGAPASWMDLDEFYRRGLVQGLDLHQRDRGYIPAGLVEEIRALAHPPVPWDAKLARWFDEYVPRPEAVRSFSRPSRRQASTPDIPRAGHYFPPDAVARCTFGVVLDTSFSMSRTLLGKALGAIASYAAARDVPAARVIYCDAAAFDAGYVPVEDIAGRVRVRGRGGTILQPGIDMLEKAEDFPSTAPILVITDGECDVVRIRREHAFLIPRGASLPFTARGPVFSLV